MLDVCANPKAHQDSLTHGFVVEFVSTEDRDYYVRHDAAHKAYVESIGDILEKAIVIDFTDGAY